jgi:hypothetical protein
VETKICKANGTKFDVDHWDTTSYVKNPTSQSNKLVGGLTKWIVPGKRYHLLFSEFTTAHLKDKSKLPLLVFKYSRDVRFDDAG